MHSRNTRAYIFDSGFQFCKSRINSIHKDVDDDVKNGYKIAKKNNQILSKMLVKYDPEKKALEYAFAQILKNTKGSDHLVVSATGKVDDETSKLKVSKVKSCNDAHKQYHSELNVLGFPSKKIEEKLLSHKCSKIGKLGKLDMYKIKCQATTELGKLNFKIVGKVDLFSFESHEKKELITYIDREFSNGFKTFLKYDHLDEDLKECVKVFITDFTQTESMKVLEKDFSKSAIGYPTSEVIEAARQSLALSNIGCRFLQMLMPAYAGDIKDDILDHQQEKVEEKRQLLRALTSKYYREELTLPYPVKVASLLSRMKFPLIKMDKSSEIVKSIAECIRNSNNADLKLLNVYSYNARPTPDGRNTMLLWHGTEAANICSILKNGYDRSEHGMFGAGIYFTDAFSMGVLRCEKPTTNGELILLLNEVHLGEYKELNKVQPDLTEPPQGYDSIKGLGQMIPMPDGWITDEYGAEFNSKEVSEFDLAKSLFYNEYVVYNASQVKVRYLVHVKLVETSE